MINIKEIVLQNSGLNWDDEIEEIIFNQDYLIEKLKKS